MNNDTLFNKFFDAYIECALWSSNDNTDESGGEPLDTNYTADDICPHALAELRNEACRFFNENIDSIWVDVELAGHDFWLTRNGHGAGFWDGDWDNGDALTTASKAYGSVDLYIGDDGKIYA
jgi:hypothetical protein